MSEVKVNKISPRSGTDVTLGDSSDTFTAPSGVTIAIASGATITNSGTATGFGGDNTPNFAAYLDDTGNALTDNTYTLVTFNQETVDSDGAFDTSTGKFTVPAGEGGTYLVGTDIRIDVPATLQVVTINIYKNGAQSTIASYEPTAQRTAYDVTVSAIGLMSLSAADYLQVYVRCDYNTTQPDVFGDSGTHYTRFWGLKLV